MKKVLTVIDSARQGELYVDKVESLPKGLRKIEPDNCIYVVAHSESGHHHVIEANQFINIYATDDPMLSYLEVIEVTDKVECLLKHLKDGLDSHNTFKFETGIYELRNQSEADRSPAGWRRATD
ncbi:MAG: hypothetical protein DDT31_01797 [Syntrophomonadaceae bacterium]|nr:hypothetical protein [Bacillota bacterium]